MPKTEIKGVTFNLLWSKMLYVSVKILKNNEKVSVCTRFPALIFLNQSALPKWAIKIAHFDFLIAHKNFYCPRQSDRGCVAASLC